jgi:DNA transformation protein
MAKNKAAHASFVAFVVEQLDSLGGVRAKSMFGGHGIYSRDVFFAVVDEGRLYFRVDDETRPRYVERGMGPFTYAPDMAMHGYYEVPVDVLEDAAELARWAREAMKAKRGKAKRRSAPAEKAAQKPAAKSKKTRRR